MELRNAIRTTGAVREFTDAAGRRCHGRGDPRRRPLRTVGWQPPAVACRGGQGPRHPARARRPHAADLGRVRGRHPCRPGAVQRDRLPAGRHGAPHIPNPLLDRIESIPVVLAVAADLRRIVAADAGLGRATVVPGASIYPFCWNVLLAAGRAASAACSRRSCPEPNRSGAAAPPARRLRTRGHDLPRAPGAPADAAAPQRRVDVRVNRHVRRTRLG